MKKIPLEQLLRESKAETYREQYQYVRMLIEKQRILPVKSSPLNGKKPALHQNYWLVDEVPDYEKLMEELKFHILPIIKTDYYLNHPEVYQTEKKWVRLLNRYFSGQSLESMPAPVETRYVSLNERSFQIWGREKFLQREQGRKILAHCGVGIEQLHVYDTTEPLAYYSASRKIPQTVLILENKDTFYSMRRHLMDHLAEGCNIERNAWPGRIFGVEIGTLVYGAGKGILRSYEDFRFCVEPHINDSKNQILYFGDLDYEGIGIYERLAVLFDNEDGILNNGDGTLNNEDATLNNGDGTLSNEDATFDNEDKATGDHGTGHRVRPFIQAYEKMVEKAEACGIAFLPETSEKQNRNLSGTFFSYFSSQTADKMICILEAGKYIPQEIINIMDFCNNGK